MTEWVYRRLEGCFESTKNDPQKIHGFWKELTDFFWKAGRQLLVYGLFRNELTKIQKNTENKNTGGKDTGDEDTGEKDTGKFHYESKED